MSPEYQEKILALMLASNQFKETAKDALGSEKFSNKALQWYYNTMCASEIELTPVTIREEMVKAVRRNEIRETDFSAFQNHYRVIRNPPTVSEQEHIRKNLGEFIRTQNVKKAYQDTMAMAKAGNYDEIVPIMEEAVNSGTDYMDLGHNYFGEYKSRIEERAQGEDITRYSFGIPKLDELTYGGLQNKQVGMVFGGTGRGKSQMLMWIAKTNVFLGKTVVYVTLELSQEKLGERLDSALCRIKPQQLCDYNERVIKDMEGFHSKYTDKLWIKHWPAGSQTVQGIATYLRQLAAAGVKVDLLCVDYLALMKCHRQYSDLVAETDAIMIALTGLASEHNIAIWSADQLNRGGMTMEMPDESSIAGYIGKLYYCDLGVFLGQTNEQREEEIIRAILGKNRNGPAGRYVDVNTEYSLHTFYTPPPQMSPDIEAPDMEELPDNLNKETIII